MGTMGSGKTTAARLIAQKLGFHLLEENFGENAFLPRFYQDMKHWAFHSQTFFLMEKISQMLSTRNLLATKKVVQDTPIQQDAFSYAKAQHVLGNMDDAEWQLYLKIYHEFEPYFPKPDLIIYLQTSISSLQKRIERRGRGYEQSIPAQYLMLLDSLNCRWLRDNKGIRVQVLRVDDFNFAHKKTEQDKFLTIVQQALNNDIFRKYSQ